MVHRTAHYTAFYVKEPYDESNLGANATPDFIYYNQLRAWKAADCFAILSGELSQNSIEIAKFNMEKCLCGRYSVSYKFFDDDACAISVWELDGRIRSIRIESHLPSQFLKYVLKDKYSPKNEARWSYVEPEYEEE